MKTCKIMLSSINIFVLQDFVAQHIAKTFERIVHSPLHDDTISPKLRSLLTTFACTHLRLPQCAVIMRTEFSKLLVTTANLTNSAAMSNLDDAYTVLCAAVAEDDRSWSTWRLVYDVIGHGRDAAVNRMLVRVLACSQQPERMRAYVGLLSTDALRKYRADIYAAAGRNVVGRMLVLQSLFDGRHNDEAQMEDVGGFFRRLCTEFEFEMLQRIFEKNAYFSRTDPMIWSTIVANIRSTIAWKHRLNIELGNVADF